MNLDVLVGNVFLLKNDVTELLIARTALMKRIAQSLLLIKSFTGQNIHQSSLTGS
jgi:hypothetical protein